MEPIFFYFESGVYEHATCSKENTKLIFHCHAKTEQNGRPPCDRKKSDPKVKCCQSEAPDAILIVGT